MEKEEKEETKFYSEPFNEHAGQTCKGHKNALTNDTYEDAESRELLIRIIDNYA